MGHDQPLIPGDWCFLLDLIGELICIQHWAFTAASTDERL